MKLLLFKYYYVYNIIMFVILLLFKYYYVYNNIIIQILLCL